MQKYLLILFSYAGLEELKEYLMNKIDQDDKLYLKAVRLDRVPKLTSHLASEVGFLGEKVVDDVEDSVVDIYKDNAQNFLEELQKTAEKNQFDLEEDLIEKDQLKQLQKAYKEIKPDQMIVNFSKNEFVSDQDREEKFKNWLKELDVHKNIFYDGSKK